MNIWIVDDDFIWLERAKSILIDFAASDGLAYGMDAAKIICFQDTDDLFDPDQAEPDLMFLDIELGDKQGIDVAHDVNQHYKDCSIIYLTNHLSYALNVYETEHIYYVLKDEFQKRLPDMMKKYDESHKLTEKMAQYKKITVQEIGGPIRTISEDNIIFCERNIRETIIHTQDRQIRTREKITSIEAQLSNDLFLRCHNSYLVALSHIESIERNQLTLDSGHTLGISRSREKDAKEIYLQWVLNKREVSI